MGWGHKIHRGAAIGGSFSALGALIWNFVFGEVIHALGFERVNVSLWIFCGLHSLGILIGVAFWNPSYYLKHTSHSAPREQGTAQQALSTLQLLRDWRVA